MEPKNWWVNAKFDPCIPRDDLPDTFDWRDINGTDFTTPIKDQGSCGSCWAFGTVAPLECNIKIKDGVEVNLSEQWLLNCNQDGWDCGGARKLNAETHQRLQGSAPCVDRQQGVEAPDGDRD